MSANDNTDRERNGRGVFDCPMDDCHEAIIGSYDDLLTHLREVHPLSEIFVKDGMSLVDEVKAARSNALRHDVEEHMVIGSRQNQEIRNGGELC